jgi:methylenetetrahydrofolate dehydrogenase (NADP+)/methenyltetrahydrofolate cyclohydrolase
MAKSSPFSSIVGNDGASLTYVGSKVKAAKSRFWIYIVKILHWNRILKRLELNENDEIDGFIVQLPLPKTNWWAKVLMAVDPSKDVDGFHPENFGKMALTWLLYSCDTFGILELLERYGVETKGKHTVVIGRSHIVGRPIWVFWWEKGFPGTQQWHTQLTKILKKLPFRRILLYFGCS